MTSDDNTRTCGGMRHAGPGHTITFLCAACQKRRDGFGKRLRRVLGLRTYVCRDCAEVKK